MPMGATTSALTALCWFYMIKHVPPEKIYGLAMIWDILAAAIFFFLPIIAFGIKLNPVGIVGLVFMTIGAILINTMNCWGK